MRAGKLGLLIWIVNAIFSFSTFAQNPPVTKEDKRVVKLIRSLREVIRANEGAIEHNGLPLMVFVDNEPTKEQPYYLVAVMQDLRESGHGVTIMRFGVYPKTYAICYIDKWQDFKEIPLKIWRKHGSKW